MMIAQHQIEAASRPTITSFTTKLALQNMAKTEPSVAPAASGVAISFMNLIPRNGFGAACAVQIGHFCGLRRKNAEVAVKAALRLTGGYEAEVSAEPCSHRKARPNADLKTIV